MSAPVAPGRVSPFQWNAGAWFGSQVGCTLWLLAGAVLLLAVAPRAALVWSCSFALGNILGLELWRRRDRLGMYTAMQLFLLGMGALSLASLVAADLAGQLANLVGGAWQPRWRAYGALLVIPSLMLRFYLREHSGGETS